MKKNKKALLGLVLSLCIVSLIGCGKDDKGKEEDNTATPTPTVMAEQEPVDTDEPKSTDPIDMIKDGYYTYSFYAEGYGDYAYFFNFYDEDPVLGSVFYAGFSNNGVAISGTYTVEKQDTEYACYEDREGSGDENVQPTEGVAPYLVTFYDWDGNVIDSCGFDGDILYNDLEAIKGAGSGPVYYHHDTEGESSKFASTYAAEVGVTYLDFIADEDATSTITLFHNMTYVDLVSMMIEGTWSMSPNADGGYDYILTPDDSSDTGAVLSVSADKGASIYTPDGGDAITMTNTALSGPQLTQLFEGIHHVAAYGTDAEMQLKLYDDGICEVYIIIFGNEGLIDSGSYAIDNYTINFNFDGAGEIQSDLDFDTQELSVEYVLASNDFGDIATVLTLNNEAVAGAEILFSFTGGNTTFDCYADNTFKFAYETYEIEETGTWDFDATSYTFKITKSDGNEIVGAIDGTDHTLSFEYVAVASDQIKDTFSASSDVWGAALVQ